MHKLTKAEIMREVKDYIYITLGLISYSLGWAAFLLPYQITTGGTYRYRSYYLLCNRISNSVVILHYQCSSDDVCHPDIGSEIQYKNDLCYFYADFSALVIPVSGKQLRRSTGYDAGR